MAKLQGLTISVGIDSTAIQKGVTNAQRSLGQLKANINAVAKQRMFEPQNTSLAQKQLLGIQNSLKLSGSEVQRFSKAYKEAVDSKKPIAEIQKLDNQLQKEKLRFAELKQSYVNFDSKVQGKNVNYNFKTNAAQLKGELGSAANSAKGLDDRLKSTAGTNYVNLISRLAVLRTGFEALKRTVGAAFQEGVSEQKSFAKVTTLIPQGSLEAVQTLKDGIRALSDESGIAASELNEGLYQALSAGVPLTNNGADAMNFFATAVRLGRAGFASTTDSVDTLTTIINSYKMSARDAEKVANKLIVTQNRGKVTVKELAQDIGKLSTNAYNSNIPLDQMLSSIALLTRNGIQSANAVTALNGIFLNINDPAKKLGKEFERIAGISFKEFIKAGGNVQKAIKMIGDDLSGTDKKFRKLLADIATPTTKLGKEFERVAGKSFATFSEQGGQVSDAFKLISKKANLTTEEMSRFEEMSNKTAKSVAGLVDKKSIGGFLVLQNATKEYAGDLAGVAKSSKELEKTYNKVLKNIEDQFTIFRNRQQNKLTNFFEPLINSLTKYLQILNKDNPTPFEKNIKEITKYTAAILGSAAAYGVIRIGLGFLSPIFRTLSSDVSRFATTLKDLPLKAFEALKVTGTTTKNILVASFNGIKNAIIFTKDALTPLANAIKSFSSVVGRYITTAFNGIVKVIKFSFQSIGEAFKLFNLVIKSTISGIGKFIFKIGEVTKINALLRGSVNLLKQGFALLSDFIKSTVSSSINLLKRGFTSLSNVIKSTVSSVWRYIHAIGQKGAALFNSILKASLNSLKNSFDFLKRAINSTVSAIRLKINIIKEAIVSNSLYQAANATLRKSFELLRTSITKVSNKIRNIIATSLTYIANGLLVIASNAAQAISFIGLSVAAKMAANSIRGVMAATGIGLIIGGVYLLGKLLAQIYKWLENIGAIKVFQDIANSITSFLKPVIDSLGNLIKGAFNFDKLGESFNAFRTAFLLIVDIFKTAFTEIGNIIKNVFDLFKNLFSGNFDGVKQNVRNILDSLMNIITTTLKNIILSILAVLKGIWELVQVIDWIKLGSDILQAIWDGIVAISTTIWGFVAPLFTQLVDAIKSIDWLKLGYDILKTIWDGIVAIGTFISKIPEVFGKIGEAITKIDWKNVGLTILQLIGTMLLAPISLISKIPGAFRKVADAIKKVDWKRVGGDILRGIWNGFTGLMSWFKDKVMGFFSGIWEGAKAIFSGKSYEESFGNKNEISDKKSKAIAGNTTKQKKAALKAKGVVARSFNINSLLDVADIMPNSSIVDKTTTNTTTNTTNVGDIKINITSNGNGEEISNQVLRALDKKLGQLI